MPIFTNRPGIYDTVNFYFTNYLCRIAVPFFFSSAGYFLFAKADPVMPDGIKIREYVFRIARLYTTWTIILFISGSRQLWYLRALIVSVSLLYLLLELKLKYSCILTVAFLIYIYGSLHESYVGVAKNLFGNNPLLQEEYRLFNSIFGTVKNGLTFGLIYVSLGAFTAYSRKQRIKTSVYGFIASMILFWAEAFLLRRYDMSSGYNTRLFQIPAVYFLFNIAVTYEMKANLNFKKIRIVSVLVYFLHNSVMYFVGIGLDFVNYRLDIPLYNNQIVDPRLFITIPVTTAISLIIEKQSRKSKWLRYLYS